MPCTTSFDQNASTGACEKYNPPDVQPTRAGSEYDYFLRTVDHITVTPNGDVAVELSALQVTCEG
jgi:hypothetical protein